MSMIGFGPVSPGDASKYMMRIFYHLVSLAPAPAFLLGFVFSVLHTPAVCLAWPYEMALMWFVMFVAHTPAWILFLQQLYFSRN
jgi:hypothetical protein